MKRNPSSRNPSSRNPSSRIPFRRKRSKRKSSNNNTRRTQGFVLLAVLFATLLVALISSSLQAAIWTSARQSRLGLSGERALHAADAAIASQLASWNNRNFAAMFIGQRITSTTQFGSGLTASVTIVRSAVDAALVEASATATQAGSAIFAQRRISRAVVMRAPTLPLQTVLTTLGPSFVADSQSLSAIDLVPAGWTNECLGVANTGAAFATPISITVARAQFDAAWTQWMARAAHLDDAALMNDLFPIAVSSNCAPGTGDPLRGIGSVPACHNEWAARLVTNANPARLTGNSRHQGVLLIDGDLVLTGTLEVNGLLVVRGSIDASAGTLIVNGAVLVRDTQGQGSRFGISTRIRYSRCALRRALSAVSVPAPVATRSWLERS